MSASDDSALNKIIAELMKRERGPELHPRSVWHDLLSSRPAPAPPAPTRLSDMLARRFPPPPLPTGGLERRAPGLPRTFVGFSSTNRWAYAWMCGWKASEHLDFDFADCQLERAVRSDDEGYIKRVCREHLKRAGTFIQLIGDDTRRKHKYVRWEAEVAIEKECRIICVNLDGWWKMNPDTCPPILRDVGALFVPFSPHVVGHAIKTFERQTSGWRHYPEETYRSMNYTLNGNIATYQAPPRP